MARLVFLLGLLGIALYADSIDNLLGMIQKKSDLSQKTKLANSGVSFVWTRDDLDRMQITNLKQILNTIYPFGYNENRYGLVDPLTYNSGQPFLSSTVRLYIDNQEITTGLYGSGVFLMGDANIDWVDHIEIYTQNPTYEYATESTVTLIKLYTKSVSKDEGSMLKVAGGSYGASTLDGYNAGYVNDWSYFVFGLASNDKREKYYSHTTELSRDKKINSIVATLHKGNTNILLNAFTQDRDGFMSKSLDATPEKSQLNAKYLHLGIDSKINNFFYLFTASYTKATEEMLDNVTPISSAPYYGMFPIKSTQTATHSYVVTGEVKYKYHKENNTLLTGLKYRTKRAKWDKALLNGINMAANDNTRIQNIATAYVENQYALHKNSIFTIGVEYQRVENRDTVQNDNFIMYRAGHTYTTDSWTVKTFYSHTLSTLEPYLVKSFAFTAHPLSYYKPSQNDTLVEDILYEKKNNKYELIFDYTQGKDYYIPLDAGRIVNYDKILKMGGVEARWTHFYHGCDKLFVQGGYRVIYNTPKEYFSNLKQYRAVVRNINTFDKFDIFNELIYNRNNVSNKNFYNYSAGVQYNYSDSFTFAIKGINLFDDARTTNYARINPVTFQAEKELNISPIDREVQISVKWIF